MKQWDLFCYGSHKENSIRPYLTAVSMPRHQTDPSVWPNNVVQQLNRAHIFPKAPVTNKFAHNSCQSLGSDFRSLSRWSKPLKTTRDRGIRLVFSRISTHLKVIHFLERNRERNFLKPFFNWLKQIRGNPISPFLSNHRKYFSPFYSVTCDMVW